MCSIVGVLSTKDFIPEKFNFDELMSHLSLRGPDHQSYTQDKNSFMAHGRLSIQDLKIRSNQPIISENSVFIYNGEIYNFNSLSKKYKIPSSIVDSDTLSLKWLLDHYQIEEFLEDLNGMFSFAYYKCNEKKIYLARDRFGMKPLFYFFLKNYLIFASDFKSISLINKKLNFPSLDLNYQSCLEFIDNGFVSSDKTIFEKIKFVEPGVVLEFKVIEDEIKREKSRFFSFSDRIDREENKKFNQNEFIYLLEKSINNHLVGDVDISLAYSYGLDSSFIYSNIFNNSQVKKIINLNYSDTSYSENDLLNQVSTEKLGNKDLIKLEYNSQSLIRELEFLSGNLLAISDPATLITSNFSRYLKSIDNKVIITGDGGDELMLGYDRHKLFSKEIPKEICRILSNIITNIYGIKNKFDRYNKLLKMICIFQDDPTVIFKQDSLQSNSLINYLSEKNNKQYLKAFESDEVNKLKSLNKKKILQNLEYNLSIPYLFSPKNDIGTSYHGIESRHPFLNNELVNYVINSDLLSTNKKFIRKDIFKEYLMSQKNIKFVQNKKVGMFPGFSEFYKNYFFKEYIYKVLEENKNNKKLPFDYSINDIKKLIFSNNNSRACFRFISLISLAANL